MENRRPFGRTQRWPGPVIGPGEPRVGVLVQHTARCQIAVGRGRLCQWSRRENRCFDHGCWQSAEPLRQRQIAQTARSSSRCRGPATETRTRRRPPARRFASHVAERPPAQRQTTSRRRPGRPPTAGTRPVGVPRQSGRRGLRALPFKPCTEFGQSRVITAVGGRQRAADQPGDLVERQSAPEPGDDHLAKFQWQLRQCHGRLSSASSRSSADVNHVSGVLAAASRSRRRTADSCSRQCSHCGLRDRARAAPDPEADSAEPGPQTHPAPHPQRSRAIGGRTAASAGACCR